MEKVEVDDAASPAPLEKTSWLSATELSAGYAWLVWPRDGASKLTPRFWWQGEGGYGWVAGKSSISSRRFRPAAPSKRRAWTSAHWPCRGFFRMATAVTF